MKSSSSGVSIVPSPNAAVDFPNSAGHSGRFRRQEKSARFGYICGTSHTGDEVPARIQGFSSFHRQIRHRESPFPPRGCTLRDSDLIPESEKSFDGKQVTGRLAKKRFKGVALEGWAGPSYPAPSRPNEMTRRDSRFRSKIRNAKPDLRRK